MGLSDEELEKIKQMHAMGMHQGEIARQLKRHPSTISRAFKKLKLDAMQAQRCATKRATIAKRAYDLKRRIELNSKAFLVAELWLDRVLQNPDELSSKDYKNIMIGYGIAEDKRQVLDPVRTDGSKSGLEEMRLKLKEKRDAMGTVPSGQQSS